jgi:ATP-dependent Clp protease ATP-binding subunit ClpC
MVFSGFSAAACEAVTLGQPEAAEFGRAYVGAEHLLLGLLDQNSALAARALSSLGITSENARGRLLILVPPNTPQDPPDASGPGPFVSLGSQVLELPFTRRATSGLEMAVREALVLGSALIDTEHILLGITRDKDSVATRILTELDAELSRDHPNRRDRDVGLEIRNFIVRTQTKPTIQPLRL